MTWDKTVPASSDQISLGDDVIRELKSDLELAFLTSGIFPGADTTNPKYYPFLLSGATSDRPSADIGSGLLFINTQLTQLEQSNGLVWTALDIVGANTVNEDKLTTSVAGEALTGGNGSPLDVVGDGTTIEVFADALRIVDGGVSANKIGDNVVGTTKLNTATGSSSGGGGGSGLFVLNDYSFFPSIATWAGQDALKAWTNGASDPGNTVGRFGMGTVNSYAVRWRYVTSSDNPRLWILKNSVGDIVSVWESEDPPFHSEEGDDSDPFEGATAEFTSQKISIIEPEEIKKILDGLTANDLDASFARFKKSVSKKPWGVDPEQSGSFDELLSGIPKEKSEMSKVLFLRAALGAKVNPANGNLKLFDNSPNDGRLVLKADFEEQHLDLNSIRTLGGK